MLGHWYTLLLLLPDDEPPATGPREVWRGSSAICTSVAGHSAITTQITTSSAIDDLEDAPP